MLDPKSLYTFTGEMPALEAPVLVHALSGFMDAGHAGSGLSEHILTNFEHEVLVRFDVDLLLDYRARRPELRFVEDHFEGYATPELVLRVVRDAREVPFLFLTGPEPDVMWERFVAAVAGLVEQLGARLTIGLHGIPMAVPHTRPLGVTMHGTRKDLVTVVNPWRGEIKVPSSISSLLEVRLGERGHDAMGVVAHVPHYLSEAEYPDASLALLRSLEAATGLVLPAGPLARVAEQTRSLIQQQVEQSEEVGRVVEALETQYDAFAGAEGRGLLAERTSMPTADEIGAEFEQFLAGLEDGDERPEH
ncbi:MAG TPA: PAC2 family protein [Jiangellaceae bacterium]|nr:PAC2 family protein [Jiangellaceae bacterium]